MKGLCSIYYTDSTRARSPGYVAKKKKKEKKKVGFFI